MLTATDIGTSLNSLANETEAIDVYAAGRLRLIREAIVSGTYASTLAKLDIYTMVDIDLVVDKYRNMQDGRAGCLIEMLELGRSVFIFVPIIVTWLSVSRATSAYHDLLAQCLKNCPDQVAQPFLYLWEQGFGGRLPDILRLSTIGLIDASILALIFTLTVIVTLLSNVRNSAQERNVQAFRSRLVETLANATLYLHDAAPVFVAPHENLDDAAKKVDAMSQHVLSRFDQLAGTLVSQFGTTTQQMQQQFSGVATKFENVAQQLSTQVNSIEKEFARQLQTSNQHLTALGKIVGGVGQLSTELQKAASTLQQTNSELSQSMNKLLVPLTDLSKQQQGLLQAVNRSVTGLDDVIKELTALDTQQKQWIGQFVDTLEVLEVSVTKIENVVSGLNDSNKLQKTFLLELQQEREQQRKLTENMTGAAQAIKDVLTGLDEGAINLRSMAADVKRVLQLQAAVTNASQMDVTSIVNGYTSAARVIERSGSALNDAATVTYDAAMALQNVVQEMEKRFTTI